MFPYIKTGGLADVVGALAPALAARGHEVQVFLPAYRRVLQGAAAAGAERSGALHVRMGAQEYAGELLTLRPAPGLTVHLVRRDAFYDRDDPYWDGVRDYPDNAERFIFFQKAVVAALLAQPQPVDIVHAHDWQTGLLPLLVRDAEHQAQRALARRTVFTTHNMIYPGIFPREAFALTNLPEALYAVNGVEYFGQISTMKAGLRYADRITTVSANYAREIQTPEHGCGLEGDVRRRAYALRGIRNGIDTRVWHPETDALLPARYSASNLAGKAVCRAALLRTNGWPEDWAGPVFCIISRMTGAKGHEVLLAQAGWFVRHGARLVVLGSGEARIERAWCELAAQQPETFWVGIKLDEPASHLTMAGADFFLMPSLTEPCGLTQMYAQAYGTIPLASRVGGLVDTVIDLDEMPATGTGLLFTPGTAGLESALERARRLFAAPALLGAARRRGMERDFSWALAVGAYERLYNETP